MDYLQRRRMRPYWHVDAKWVCGLLLVVALSVALIAFNVMQATAEPTAVDMLAKLMAASYRPGWLEPGGEVDRARERLETILQGAMAELLGQKVELPSAVQESIATGPSVEAFAPIARAYYQGGATEARRVADPALARAIPGNVGLWSLLTQRAHRVFRRVTTFTGIAAFLLAVAMVSFSAGFGRIGSLGLVLTAVGLPWYALLRMFTGRLMASADLLRGSSPALLWLLGPLAIVPTQVLPQLLGLMVKTYHLVTVVGLGLLAIALVGSFVWRLVGRRGEP